VFFLVTVVVAWGLVWPVNKVLLASLTPLWLMTLRSAIATAALFAIAAALGRLARPPRADLPVLLSITLLHMVGFGVLAAWGLALVPTGRSVVLAYTTPLWVVPGAALFLGDRLTPRRLAGVAMGLIGLGALFNPLAFDWTDRYAVLGNAAIVGAALLWAASILHIRGHRWQSTPFDLVPWEMLLATLLVAPLALAADGPPSRRPSSPSASAPTTCSSFRAGAREPCRHTSCQSASMARSRCRSSARGRRPASPWRNSPLASPRGTVHAGCPSWLPCGSFVAGRSTSPATSGGRDRFIFTMASTCRRHCASSVG
jgi:drug/metabolite transporter (DMT)-like permease